MCKVQGVDDRLPDIGKGMAGQTAEPGLYGVDALRIQVKPALLTIRLTARPFSSACWRSVSSR